jgi:long-chain acyl-CoA synthetase
VNLASSLARSARDHAERTVIRFGDAAMTYRELDERSGRVAGLLRELGFQAGDRVGVMLPNVPEFAVAYYGVLRAGGVVVPMNPLLKAREVAYYFGDSGAQVMLALAAMADEAQAGSITAGARTVVVDDDFGTMLASAPLVDEVVDRDGSDTAVILYTSGTTGQPKGAELTHDSMRRNAEVYVANLVQLTSDDVTFGGLPLFHSFGQTCCLNATVAAGAGLTLLPRFDPAHALRTIAEHGATVFAGVPTMYGALLGVPERKDHDTSAMRVCVSGGSALPLEVLRAFDKSFGCKILEGYGLSETSPVASFNHPDRPRKAGSIGTPIEGVQMRVVDESGVEVAQGEVGEIAIRGHNVMKGYWRRPADTAAAIPDGWFRSGDLGRMDEDGYFFIVDRKKDMIIRGGYNVYPREIEEVLYEHPAVAEAAVIGLPDPLLGEEVAAVVVLKGGAATTVYELREHVKSQVAGYKYPTARVVRRHPAQGADRQDPQAGHPRPGRPEHAMTSPDGGPTDRADPAAPDARPVTAARSPLDFRDRTVFVAGGTSGINLGIAEGFAAAGARVAVMSRKPAKVDAAVGRLRALGARSMGVAADVRDVEATREALTSVHAAFGEIDVLVSGAAGNFPATALGMSPNAFRSVVEIDLLGTYHVLRSGHQYLRKPGAVVINISAPQAFLPWAAQSHVCAAKAGVDMLTRVLAIEWGADGVRVNGVVPGPIDGTEGMARLAPTAAARAAVADTVPLARWGTPADIADACLLLASPLAAYITGVVLPVDGGWSLGGATTAWAAIQPR